jgi:SAM-dependent methyltransferase
VAQPVRERESFDTVAELYDAYRFQYPRSVVRHVVATADLGPGRRMLEVGCGTGQLTRALAAHGASIDAVELGANLAALARANLAAFPDVHVYEGDFDHWRPPGPAYDAVVAANAFHWLDPHHRAARAAHALAPGGALCLVLIHHVRGGTPGFVARSNEVYHRFGLSDPEFELPRARDVAPSYLEVDESGYFDRITRTPFALTRRMDTAHYIGHLNTDSLILTLDEHRRRRFLATLARLVDTEFDGQIARRYVYDVVVARRNEVR